MAGLGNIRERAGALGGAKSHLVILIALRTCEVLLGDLKKVLMGTKRSGKNKKVTEVLLNFSHNRKGLREMRVHFVSNVKCFRDVWRSLFIIIRILKSVVPCV